MTKSYKHISEVADESLEYIIGRRNGTIKSLSTGFDKLDEVTMDGFEFNRVITFAGKSGTGKSLAVSQICENLKEHNSEPFDILKFELEMIGKDQISRKLSGRMSKSIQQLYSVGSKLDASSMNTVKDEIAKIKKQDIYYCDFSGSATDLINIIEQFRVDKNPDKKRGLVVVIDHILLVTPDRGDSRQDMITKLERKLVNLKKMYEASGNKIIIIQVCQLNRNIDAPERFLNPKLHYPTETDIFGSSDIFFASDLVIITHKPSLYKLDVYGPPILPSHPRGLPVYNPWVDFKQSMIYWHIVKNRMGPPSKTLMMLDNFKNSKVDEYKPKT